MPVRLDEIDRRILELLTANGRRTVRDIAAEVRLSPAPVKRRIERLERAGVIEGYTVRIDHERLGSSVEAFTAIRYTGRMSIGDIFTYLAGIPEVLDVYTTTGDSDAIVHIRADDVAQLQRVVHEVRTGGELVSTKTWVVMEHRAGTGRAGEGAGPPAP